MAKGLSTKEFLVGIIVLAIVAVIILGGVFQRGIEAHQSTYSEITLEANRKACLGQGKWKGCGTNIVDKDNDCAADSCDKCLGGNDNVDKNGDGIPDACEPINFLPDKDTSLADICNGAPKCDDDKCWVEERGQCKRSCYPNAC
jgi:hypothetical protein